MPAPAPAPADHAARTRRSVREFKPDAVDLADVTRILQLGALAPSAWNLQPWRFVVVTDPATKEKLQAAAYGQKQVGSAPVVVAIYADMVAALERVDEALHPSMPAESKATYKGNILGAFARMTPAERDKWGKEQANIALGYLLLLFEVHGYGTSPMLGFDPPQVRAVLGLPDHAEIPALLAVGMPAAGPSGPPHRFPFAELARFVGESPAR